MSKAAYTDEQIEIANLLHSVTTEGVPADVVDQVLEMVKARQQPEEQPKVEENIDLIKLKLMDETNWRKRAALGAMLISKSLEGY